MTRTTGGRQYESHGQETDPRDGGCPRCGGETRSTTEPIDGRPATDCENCGIVEIGRSIATDGGTDDDGCDDCAKLDGDLPCWECYREQHRDRDDDSDTERDAPEPVDEHRENEEIRLMEDRAERALERGLWGVGGGRR